MHFFKSFFSFVVLLAVAFSCYSQNKVDSVYVMGHKYLKYQGKGYRVALTVAKDEQYYSNYYKVSIILIDDSIARYDYVPEGIKAEYVMKGKRKPAKVLTYEQLMKVMKENHECEVFALGLMAFNSGFSAGLHPQSASIGNTVMLSSANASLEDEIYNLSKSSAQSYLQRNTFVKGNTLNAYFDIVYKKCKKLLITIPTFNGESINCEWEIK
jgi:hypothetical protein